MNSANKSSSLLQYRVLSLSSPHHWSLPASYFCVWNLPNSPSHDLLQQSLCP